MITFCYDRVLVREWTCVEETCLVEMDLQIVGQQARFNMALSALKGSKFHQLLLSVTISSFRFQSLG